MQNFAQFIPKKHNRIRDALKLLLHCQPKVLAQSKKIMSVLNGRFKSNKGENGSRSSKFFYAVCEELPDAIVISNERQVITRINKSAKEIVNFGLDALDAITDLNKELNESLKIRVGYNTGGPIIAGVLGVGKPTFEILGPAINMAQHMEHHGVPSKVHVSRSVYELIYGDLYDIKERGQFEVKNGTVVTFIVVRKK
ncbi:hypothetical protein M9Y10_032114 [Tritrichomonas musculus]|uniref:adenylate cyclase n=1 Tax=Tritrichomonas musculus TaxID=1915356 RepID=A0ABR2GZ67_9EUKA